MTVSAAAFATLEQLINQAIRLDPEAPARLEPMFGRVIRLDLLGFGLSLYLIPEPGGIQLLSDFEGEPDCALRGTPLDLAAMRGNRKSADQLFSGAVEIEGDSALAHRFGDFLSALDIDWEEQFSHLTGDLIAHEVGNAARSLFGWGKKLRRTSGQNLQEYLQEELRLLPSRYEIEPFLAGVDTLRDDVERLAARLQRLRAKAVS
ncbi:MAG: sterol-binding protein [Gammaproteobacteria bacterium (ex Lamellibrachia satsuma)]|nr:MAG: sterol-binding protein [Gammaproteobacteria bacterium (ex Lamellibrachia satsuma)]RRS33768.1 MAG: sterol-binding protein [Gammaproteobacteria bacterium (ex Lamellibrachia satsuma)]RRS37562.1 MAG: sterol-binding protein [Gammaproteobacteria bacterium (ex Lamellibrachia satsuma)]